MEQQQSQGDVTNGGLTPAQLQQLREKLETLRTQLLARRAADEEALRDDSEKPIEAIEAAVRTREQDDGILAVDRERALLAEIEDALARMDAGRYGISARSGAPIDFRRLQAVPWARLTADEEEG